MDPKLYRLYSENRNPVVFLDESYELRESGTFYVLASAIVYPEELNASRNALLDFNNGEPLHAAPMYKNREIASLRMAIELVAKQHDGMDLIVQAPIESDDANGRLARNRCLWFIAPMLHKEIGASLFVLDSLETPAANRLDQYAFRDLRQSGELSRYVIEHHTRPSLEPLLGLPDLLAWSYRQQLTVNNANWFKPLESQTRVHKLG